MKKDDELRPGMRNGNVKSLKEKLLNLGYQLGEHASDHFDDALSDVVKLIQEKAGLNPDGVVTTQTLDVIEEELRTRPREDNRGGNGEDETRWIVRGIVQTPDGQPLPGATVKAYDKGIRQERTLGGTTTNEKGRYELAYRAPPSGRVSLLVRAFNREGTEIAASEIICKASPEEVVDLVQGDEPFRGASEYDALDRAVTPLLDQERLRAKDLNEEDVKVVACKLDLVPEHLAYYVVSDRLHAAIDVRREALYGLVRMGLPTDEYALVGQPPALVRRTLTEAVEQNVVSPPIIEALPKILKQFADHITRLALRETEPDDTSMADILDAAGLAADRRRPLIDRYVKHTGSVKDFWEEVKAQGELTSGEVEDVQYSVAVAAIGLKHKPFIRRVMQLRGTNGIGRDFRDLSHLDAGEWKSVLAEEVNGEKVGAPATLGGDEDERIDRFANFLARIMELSNPTPALTGRLKRRAEVPEGLQPVLEFVELNPDFDFRATRFPEYLRDHPAALDGVRDPEATRTAMATAHRLFDIVPENRDKVLPALLQKKIVSAWTIRRQGAAAFLRKNSDLPGGRETAEEVYRRADLKVAAVTHALSLTMAVNPVNLLYFDFGFLEDRIATLQDLFGSLSQCQCEHCASVLSPAAYLVDVLHWLDNRDSTDPESTTALDVLLSRRPDIGEIELNCHNTLTPVPYVDLVIEVLEHHVVGQVGFTNQTTRTANELRANPEHLLPEAYGEQHLASAIYPWLLPFNLWLAEARAYLGHLGVPLHELMRHFRLPGGSPTDLEVAGESLNLSTRDREIVTGTAPEAARDFWGLPAPEPGWSTLLTTRRTRLVLDQSGLSFEELRPLLDVPFINLGLSLQMVFPEADCDLETATITNLGVPNLDRMHRFVRLQRKLGWTTVELGKALETLGKALQELENAGPNADLDDAMLQRLAEIKSLRDNLKVSFDTLLSWWRSKLETRSFVEGEEPLYDRTFLRFDVNNEALEVFELDDAREELRNSGMTLPQHAALVHGALGITAEAFSELVEQDLPDDTLSLANLTRLYQAVSLSKTLKLSVPDYLSLRHLAAIDPFGPNQMPETVKFVETSDVIKASGLSLPVLDYLFRHRVASTVTEALSDEQIGQALRALREGLAAIRRDHAVTTDPDGAQTAAKLALVLAQEEVNRAITIISGVSEEDNAAQEDFIETSFASFLDTAEAVATLVNDTPNLSQEARFNFILDRLQPHLIRAESRNLVIQSLAETFGLETEVAEALLTRFVSHPVSANEPSISLFLEPSFAEVPEQPQGGEGGDEIVQPPLPDPADFPDHFHLFHRLQKNALLLISWKVVKEEEVVFLFEQGPALGWLDLNALPVEQTDDSQSLFLSWMKMTQVIQAWARLRATTTNIFTFLDAVARPEATREAALDIVAEQSLWPRADLEFLTGGQAFNLQFPEDYRDGQFLVRLSECFRWLKRLGVSARDAWDWAHAAELGAAQERAQAIKQAVKLRYDDAQWIGIAKPLRDQIREQQRQALVAYVIEHATDSEIDSPNKLYGHLLLDVEMAPCMMTSRMKLAMSSAQLFVQRILLNLEKSLEFDDSDRKEWDWMKLYRVWEANRKVFLYPENWIDPALRDDKTPFFTDLEDGLLQDEITDATVEREYLKYLEKLHQVANLEISGIYRERERDKDILHVIARTRNKPSIYFYRRWINQTYWTSWERVDAGIEGDHLAPVIWNRRLYLFWPTFFEKAEKTIPSEDGGAPPEKFLEVKIAFSSYYNGKWQPKIVSEEFEELDWFSNVSAFSLSVWTSVAENGDLIVNIGARGIDVQFEVVLKQFRFVACSNTLRPVPSTAAERTNAVEIPPGTRRRFVAFEEKDQHSLELVTSIDFLSKDLGSNSGSSKTEVLLYNKGRFRIIPSHAERPLISRLPFFFQDDRRTFLIVPRGRYTSNGTVENDLVIESNPTHIPLELPDVVTTLVARRPGDNRDRSTTGRGGEDRVEVSTAASSVVSERGEVVNPILATAVTPRSAALMQWVAKSFAFHNHYHPYTCVLLEQLTRHGIAGLLDPDPEAEVPAKRSLARRLRRQQLQEFYFSDEYGPQQVVLNVKGLDEEERKKAGPADEFDFSYSGAYGVYNMELFFHAPFMIATRLSAHQRFADAHRWFHYIFNPTYQAQNPFAEPWPFRVWQVKPFFEEGKGRSIQGALLLLKSTGLTKKEQEDRTNLIAQIEAWRQNPFKPHLIARMRPVAYMKAVAMAYLDHLIAWGDMLFRRDTIESLNEATQLYILAAEILGERPTIIKGPEGVKVAPDGTEVRTFNDLRPRLDQFSNALLGLEEALAQVDTEGAGTAGGFSRLLGTTRFRTSSRTDGSDGEDRGLFLAAATTPEDDDATRPVSDPVLENPTPAPLGSTLFFCISKNDKLLSYWDTVEDRLFKIRHCMNIEGVVRQLPLFQPPIDPALLVKAAAAGLDIASALNNLNAPLPHYRFQGIIQKAKDLCNDVKSLGGALLSALEKGDAEELSLLRATHELSVLEAVRAVKIESVAEAKENKASLDETRKVTEGRQTYYSSRERTNSKESQHLKNLEKAFATQTASQVLELLAGAMALIPDFDVGTSGVASPVVKARFGGSSLSTEIQVYSRALQLASSIHSYEANKASIEGGHDRRMDDWTFQADQAEKELSQVDKQIAAAEIRTAIAEQDLSNHELQIENASQVDEYLRGKFSNRALYSKMQTDLSGVYFQSYQMAYDVAKRAERCMRYELGLDEQEPNIIQFGYWDNLKKGLLAGEKLYHDLNRLEMAFLEKNKRELELTKHVSIAMLNPLALLELREKGSCEIELPEVLFDLDFPGHYFRRIKSVGITIPCVTGPYTSVNCTLRLLKDTMRARPSVNDEEEGVLRERFGGTQAIATSTGQQDRGLFQFEFRDERYLPFEGAGVVSRWRIELPSEFRQFDYQTITDVILHVSYTARDAGQRYADEVQNRLKTALEQAVSEPGGVALFGLFSARSEFASEWHRFLHPSADAEHPSMALDLSRRRFPFPFRDKTITIIRVELFLKLQDDDGVDDAGLTVNLTPHEGSPTAMEFQQGFGELFHATTPSDQSLNGQLGTWLLEVEEGGIQGGLASEEDGRLNASAIRDLAIVCHYRVT